MGVLIPPLRAAGIDVHPPGPCPGIGWLERQVPQETPGIAGTSGWYCGGHIRGSSLGRLSEVVFRVPLPGPPPDEPRRRSGRVRDGRLRPRGGHLGLHLQDSLPGTPDEPPGLGNGAGDALGPRDPEVFVSVAGVDLRDFLGS